MSGIIEIEIVKTPDGPAPEWVRKEWVGIRLLSIPLPLDAIEKDFIKNKPIGNRGGVAVDAETAISRLAEKSVKAADWFRQNIPPGMPLLTFGPTEFNVV